MSEFVTIAVDAQGGDGGFSPVLEGVRLALLADPNLQVALCGQPEVINDFVSSHERCLAIECGEPIQMGEHPADAVKAKKDSSIVKGCKLVAAGEAQGFFSAGSTGACLVSATLNIGRLKGVKRPALGVILPAKTSNFMLLDVGANADCKVEYLPQFAIMGAAYMNKMHGVASPRIGLLNIGEEPTKGSMFAQDAFSVMSKTLPTFDGNCESKNMIDGEFDVVVTDGFTGNVCLKTMEATASLVLSLVKGALTSNATAKIGAALAKNSLTNLKDKLNPDTFGGSPLLGVKGVCVIGHGASSSTAIKNGILTAAREVRAGVGADIEAAIAAIERATNVVHPKHAKVEEAKS